MVFSYFYPLLFLISVFISAIAQILLKKEAGRKQDSLIKEYLNLRVIFAYGVFFFSTLLTVFAYRGVPLSLGPVLEATGYFYVAVLGTLFLKEKMEPRKIFGNVLIILGIIIFGMGK